MQFVQIIPTLYILRKVTLHRVAARLSCTHLSQL